MKIKFNLKAVLLQVLKSVGLALIEEKLNEKEKQN